MLFRRFLLLIPLCLLMVLLVFLARRLQLIDQGQTPELIPSAMISKPAPEFNLHALRSVKPYVTSADLKGHVTLVSIFASWCVPCQAEHPYLASIKRAGVQLVGINYKDTPDAARAWLQKMGNPYDAVATDIDGRVAIDFGSYGVPESYLVDKQGVIRYKQTGPLTPEVIDQRILPMAKELNQ